MIVWYLILFTLPNGGVTQIATANEQACLAAFNAVVAAQKVNKEYVVRPLCVPVEVLK